MSFGERLQALRRSNNLTQEEFAEQLKVSRQAVSKWESSRGYPEIEKIIYICNHYGITMNELFLDEVPPPVISENGKEQAVSAEEPLKNPSLKGSLSNFFHNLTPRNQLAFMAGLIIVTLALITLLCTTLSKGENNPVYWKFIWLALLILFGVGEALTVGLTSIWFAAGSLAALIAALLNGPIWLQVVLFIVVTVLSLLTIRPLATRYLNDKVEPTNADRIIGSEAYVIEPIDNLHATGAVRVAGVVWSARSAHETPIAAGTLVRILRIEGVKVYVEEAKEEVKCQS